MAIGQGLMRGGKRELETKAQRAEAWEQELKQYKLPSGMTA